MESNKGTNFFFMIIAIITGKGIVEKFDFQNMTFEKPVFAIINIIGFICCIIYFVKLKKSN